MPTCTEVTGFSVPVDDTVAVIGPALDLGRAISRRVGLTVRPPIPTAAGEQGEQQRPDNELLVLQGVVSTDRERKIVRSDDDSTPRFSSVQTASSARRRLSALINLRALLHELDRLLLHALLQRFASALTPCFAAYSRTSCVIFIEQKCGPHIEQKCAVFIESFGSVSS